MDKTRWRTPGNNVEDMKVERDEVDERYKRRADLPES